MLIKLRSKQQIKSLNLVVSSFTGHILMYDDFQLVWATKHGHVAHALAINTYQGIKGLITTLNDEGWLTVSYLGTE